MSFSSKDMFSSLFCIKLYEIKAKNCVHLAVTCGPQLWMQCLPGLPSLSGSWKTLVHELSLHKASPPLTRGDKTEWTVAVKLQCKFKVKDGIWICLKQNLILAWWPLWSTHSLKAHVKFSFFLFGDLKVTQNYKHKTDVIHPRYLKQKTCTMGLTMPWHKNHQPEFVIICNHYSLWFGEFLLCARHRPKSLATLQY